MGTNATCNVTHKQTSEKKELSNRFCAKAFHQHNSTKGSDILSRAATTEQHQTRKQNGLQQTKLIEASATNSMQATDSKPPEV